MDFKEYQKQVYNEFGIDRTLLIANLKLTPTQRINQLEDALEFVMELRRARKEKDDYKIRNSSPDSHGS